MDGFKASLLGLSTTDALVRALQMVGDGHMSREDFHRLLPWDLDEYDRSRARTGVGRIVKRTGDEEEA